MTAPVVSRSRAILGTVGMKEVETKTTFQRSREYLF